MLLNTMRNTRTVPCTTQTGCLVYLSFQRHRDPGAAKIRFSEEEIIFSTDLSHWSGSVCDLKNIYVSAYCLPYTYLGICVGFNSFFITAWTTDIKGAVP